MSSAPFIKHTLPFISDFPFEAGLAGPIWPGIYSVAQVGLGLGTTILLRPPVFPALPGSMGHFYGCYESWVHEL